MANVYPKNGFFFFKLRWDLEREINILFYLWIIVFLYTIFLFLFFVCYKNSTPTDQHRASGDESGYCMPLVSMSQPLKCRYIPSLHQPNTHHSHVWLVLLHPYSRIEIALAVALTWHFHPWWWQNALASNSISPRALYSFHICMPLKTSHSRL